MKKITAVIAVVLLLCCACVPSNEEGYIAQLEQRIDYLEQQLSVLQESAANTKLPEAGLSLPVEANTQESFKALPETKASESMEVQETAGNAAVSEETTDKGTTVYITKSGKKYHKKGCGSLSKSCIPISIDDALAKGYTPCGKCKPPQ